MVLSFIRYVVRCDRYYGLTITEYLLETNGEASFARNGWFAIMRAAGLVVENNRLEELSDYFVNQWLCPSARLQGEGFDRRLAWMPAYAAPECSLCGM